MTTRRPANDDHAAALEEELIEEIAQQECADAMAGPPSPTGVRMELFARELERQVRSATRRAKGPTVGSQAAIDVTRLGCEADAVPLAIGSTDGEPSPVAAVRDLDTARIGRLSRAELVRVILTHACRELEAASLDTLSDADLRDKVRALRRTQVPVMV